MSEFVEKVKDMGPLELGLSGDGGDGKADSVSPPADKGTAKIAAAKSSK